MLPVGIEFDQRSEDESALMKAWVRDGQRRTGQNAIIIQQQIEIERARPVAILLVAPQRPFDFTTNFQQTLGCDVCFDLRDAV